MKRKTAGKLFAGVLLAGLLTCFAVFPAFAEIIRSLNLSFDGTCETGQISEPQVSVSTDGVSIDSVKWNKSVSGWKPGAKVTATVTLSADGGDTFLSSYGERSLKISGAELGSAKKSGENLKVTAYYYPSVQLEAPEEAGWRNANKTIATWDKVKYATAYQIKLYLDGNYIKTIDADGTTKDLSEYMTKEGTYSYEVRAMAKDSGDAKYMKSSGYTASTDSVAEDLGDTDGTWKLYVQGKKYQKADGTLVTGQWYRILGEWYYFNADGYAVTGWNEVGGKKYYMDEDGVMQTGWLEDGGDWYYLNADGSMATGWCQASPNQWYYLNEDGTMASNASIDGRTLNEDGLWVQ